MAQGKAMNKQRKWQKVGSKTVYSDDFFWITLDEVIRPDGKTSQYGVYHTHGALFIVALTKDGRFVFVRQHRYPVYAQTIEIVAGGLPETADPLGHAKVELNEE